MRIFSTLILPRTFVCAAVLALGVGEAAMAADKVELIYSDTVPENDIRSRILKEEFGACLGDEFDFKPYFGATLFKQGTELTALRRGNLDMSAMSVYDFPNQLPEYSILGAGYLYRDYKHMRAVWDSDVLDGLMRLTEEKLGIKILTNPYIGARHVNISGKKKVMTPADLNGVKLRMPNGEGWQFLGNALGANATPMAFTEVYTALQTGAVDGQDNSLPTDRSMKFYEVTDQIVLTGHVLATNQFAISMRKWQDMTETQQAKVQECADNFRQKLDESTMAQEAELVDFFRSKGLEVYEPDLEAFQKHVQAEYLKSDFADAWPEGLLDAINAVPSGDNM